MSRYPESLKAPATRWWTRWRVLVAVLWLAVTLGVSLVTLTIVGGLSGLSDQPDDGPVARWSAGAAVLGTLGLLGVWAIRRSRPWLISAIIYALYGVFVVVWVLLEG